MDIKVKETIENLNKNGMETVYVEKTEDICSVIEKMIPKNSTVGVGGSVSLNECGALTLLRNGNYRFFDRYDPNLDAEGKNDALKKSLGADFFLSSANAITEKGEIYNVDGLGNRVAALNFGPKTVIFVVGKNKIVKDLKEADIRVKTIAAPKNAVRLNKKTPCAKLGKCLAVANNTNCSFNDGCLSEDRICRNYLILGKQKNDGRIKVIICNEPLGY